MSETRTTTRNGRGRPRDSAVQRAILQATRDEMIDTGYLDLTIERIASRSGVAKTTIYRWWPSKAYLVIEAISPVFDETNPVDPGIGDSLRTDLTRAVHRVSRGMSATVGHHVIAGLMASCAQDPAAAEEYRRKVLQPRRAAVTKMLEHWRDRGEIDPNVDLDFVQDLYVGPIFYRALVAGTPVDGTLQDKLVDAVLAAVAPQRRGLT